MHVHKLVHEYGASYIIIMQYIYCGNNNRPNCNNFLVCNVLRHLIRISIIILAALSGLTLLYIMALPQCFYNDYIYSKTIIIISG